jgi:Transposase DDE domain group 1
MEVTLRVAGAHRDSRSGRIEIRADDETLTPYAGLAVTGQLVRALRLVPLLDAELGQVRRARPVKLGARGLSGGELLVSLAECQLVGGQCFSDVEDLRADRAGAALRAVREAPSAPTARQLAGRFGRSHIQAAERALARAGCALDGALDRDPAEPVTIDLDATGIEVFGRRNGGARRSRHGAVSYAPHVAFWAERGRPLCSELVGGNSEKLSGKESAKVARRALSLLPDGHGEATFRIDSAYYALELLTELRKQDARFTVSLPRTSAMWKALERVPDDAWRDAREMDGAQIAEAGYAPEGWEHERLRLIVRRGVLHARADREPELPPPPHDPPRAAPARARRQARPLLRLQLHPHRPRRRRPRAGALPPPPRPDRGTPQGSQARTGAAPPALRLRARQVDPIPARPGTRCPQPTTDTRSEPPPHRQPPRRRVADTEPQRRNRRPSDLGRRSDHYSLISV